MQFKQGDKAICTLTDSPVEVQFGPFLSASGKEAYLVKGFNGDLSSVVWTEDLQPAPKFKEGQEVHLAGVRHTVAAGPFNSGSDDWYVLENRHGHTTCNVRLMGDV
jgi:hypothetical protein